MVAVQALMLEPDRFRDEYLTELALGDMGYSFVFDRDGSSGRVEIVNAYNQVLYASKLASRPRPGVSYQALT